MGVGGKVTVPVRGGAWAIQPPRPPQKPALLRFWLEFPEEAKRNDVTLPPGRVFFTAPVWQEIELERGAEARKEARERYEEAETKSAELADEAVKANPLAKIFGLRKQVLALDEKNAALRRLERVDRYLGGSSDGGAGPFPGLAAGASLTLGTTGGLVVERCVESNMPSRRWRGGRRFWFLRRSSGRRASESGRSTTSSGSFRRRRRLATGKFI